MNLVGRSEENRLHVSPTRGRNNNTEITVEIRDVVGIQCGSVMGLVDGGGGCTSENNNETLDPTKGRVFLSPAV